MKFMNNLMRNHLHVAIVAIAVLSALFETGCRPRRPRKSFISSSEVGLHDKVQLWAGGPYWATTNIGAEEPWETGYSFYWGDIAGHKYMNGSWTPSDRSTSGFKFDEKRMPHIKMNFKDLRKNGWITGNGNLVSDADAAKAHWGGPWRMPTKKDMDDLRMNCDWNWTSKQGVMGYEVSGKSGKFQDEKIFLPAIPFSDFGCPPMPLQFGFYWTSVPNDKFESYCLKFRKSEVESSGLHSRLIGMQIRPVQ